MNNWLTNNWDKLATLLLGGVIGFFSALITTNLHISTLAERVAKLESAEERVYKPGYQKMNKIELDLISTNNSLQYIKAQQELTDKLVELHTKQFQVELEKVREETINALKKLIAEAKKKP